MRLSNIIQGARPKTLAAAIVPPVCAYAIYMSQNNEPKLSLLLLCIFLALFLQVATNFYNDAIDFMKGADSDRVGPKRLAADEKMSPKIIMKIGHGFLILAALVGIPLIIEGGVVYLVLALVSLFFAYGYTGGPFPLAYLGLGELFVFLFFGLVATLGSYYLYASAINYEILIVALQLGFLSCVLIAINNLRDRITDKKVGKNTLATRMSEYQFLKLIDVFLFVPYILVFVHSITIKLSFIAGLLAIGFAHRIRYQLHINKNYNLALALAGKQLVFFCVLYCIGSLWK